MTLRVEESHTDIAKSSPNASDRYSLSEPATRTGTLFIINRLNTAPRGIYEMRSVKTDYYSVCYILKFK
jgi:hypothetical protein